MLPSSNRLFLLYSLSGFVSLGYQVVWFRIYIDKFGSTNLTFMVVLCSFIAGLGFGALASRTVCHRLGRWCGALSGLRIYGLVEVLICLGVGLTLIVSFMPSAPWGVFPYQEVDGIYQPNLIYVTARLVTASVCVFIPSFLMGVTFPLLCQLFNHDKRFPSRLYAWNTLGACLGVLACQFVFLPRLGHGQTFVVLIGLNGLLGGYFLMSKMGAGLASAAPGDSSNGQSTGPPTHAPALITLGALSGLLTGALEGDLFKRMWFLGAWSGSAMVFVSFWAILAIFLASATITRFPRLRLIHLKLAMTVGLIVYAGLSHFAHQIRNGIAERYRVPFETHLSPELLAQDIPVAVFTDPFFALVFVGLFTFPVIYLTALVFPYVCNSAQGDKRSLDLTYGANTLAFCTGIVVFTWLAPRVSIFYSLKLVMVVVLIGVVFCWSLRETGRVRVWKFALAGLALIAGVALTPQGFDRALLDPRMQVYHYPVRALKSNGAHTTYVVAHPAGDALYFDAHPMSGTNRASQVYMRLMAHVPLLSQASPHSALLIGFGVRNTASAIAAHSSIRRIDIVDLNVRVFETVPEFAQTNARVYEDPRVRFIHDDGRGFLRTTNNRYDLINSEPPPPMQNGVFRLYSREYYEDARAHLTERGMLSQWLPIDQLSAQSIGLMVGTFVKVFPHALLFSGYARQLILIGANAPIDLKVLEHRVPTDASVVADLRRLGIDAPVDLLLRVIQLNKNLHDNFIHTATISDQRNDLAYLPTNPLGPTKVSYDPDALLAELKPLGLASYAQLESLVVDSERLHYRVADFPFGWLKLGPEASTDWQKLAIVMNRYRHDRGLDSDETLVLLEEMVAVSPRHPRLLLELARHQLSREEHAAAVASVEKFRVIEPDDIAGTLALGAAYLGLGDSHLALDLAQETLLRGLESPALYLLEADALRHLERPVEALAAYDRALVLDPNYVDALRNKGAVLEYLSRGVRREIKE